MEVLTELCFQHLKILKIKIGKILNKKSWSLVKDWPDPNLNKWTSLYKFGQVSYLCSEDSNTYFQTSICYTLMFCVWNT